jgi:hypothetical protein
MSKQGFGIVCIEIKNNHFESGDLEEGSRQQVNP